jgi:hypothetical protein
MALYEKSRQYMDANDSYDTMVKKRIEILNETMQPILVPTLPKDATITSTTAAKETAIQQDITRWKDNPHFLKWFRTQTLLAQYGPLVKEALDAYPQLRHSPQLSRSPLQYKLLQLARGRIEVPQFNTNAISPTATTRTNTNGPQSPNTKPKPQEQQLSMLPSTDTLVKAFQMKDWAKEKTTQRKRPRIETNYNTGIIGGEETNRTSSQGGSSMVDLLDRATQGQGGYICDLGPFNVICEEANMYQWWTKEYVETLANYLLRQPRTPDIVLDVGAGDGILLNHLRRYYQKQHQNPKQQRKIPLRPTASTTTPTPTATTKAIEWIATDDASWRIFPKAPVEKLTVEQTLEKYAGITKDGSGGGGGGHHSDGNRIITDTDSSNIRNHSVIVICSWMPMGQDWTQLFRQYDVDEYILIGEADDGSCGHRVETWGGQDDSSNTPTTPPAYEVDGYRRRDLVELHPYQFSRFDTKQSKNGMTVSFRKIGC